MAANAHMKLIDQEEAGGESKAHHEAVGMRIAERRKQLGMTQADLARKIGRSQQAVLAYEKAERRVATDTQMKIAKALRTTLEYLITGKGGTGKVPKFKALTPRTVQLAEKVQELGANDQRALRRIVEAFSTYKQMRESLAQ